MHRITMDTKHGLSGRFAMNMKTPELIFVLRGAHQLTTTLQHYNNTEQWQPAPPQTLPGQLDGLFETERETLWPGWLSWLPLSEGGGRYRRICRASQSCHAPLFWVEQLGTTHKTGTDGLPGIIQTSEQSWLNCSNFKVKILSCLPTLTRARLLFFERLMH